MKQKLDLNLAQKAIERHTRLKVCNIKIIGEGFRSIATEVNGKYIFLFGRIPLASQSFEKEYKLLPKLQALLPCKIPNPRWFIKKARGLPYGILGYPKIEGIVLTKNLLDHVDLDALACDVAAFLAALHSIDSKHLKLESNPQPLGFYKEDEELKNRVLPVLKTLVTPQEYNQYLTWWNNYLNNADNFNFEPRFIHGDMWYENLLLDKNLKHLVGVIDFEACGFGDIAIDFAPLYYLGEGFTRRVLSEYQNKTGADTFSLLPRIQNQRIKREFLGLHYAIENKDQEELKDSLEKIRKVMRQTKSDSPRLLF